MRFVTLPGLPSVVDQLSLMIESDDKLVAFKGRTLLELVRLLEAGDPAREVFGNIHLRELWLSPHRAAAGVQVKVWVDWQDYGPVRDGLPEFHHYRFQIERKHSKAIEDPRAATPAEAEKIICRAFGWTESAP